ncbi:hypothetical protein Nepgr_006412 [Nepenthes gracilis]|uniref:Isopenicillin N synthase-like Fe(2+) 2OG dioxygenase domain-containing protein n=1 Tax=Nepenthes gracilis TaxID=150966 RepID=A0AAD3XHB4_NEPGR|nr:hypothetical protein Nepgr_006412 [Nepenthes gracilis]
MVLSLNLEENSLLGQYGEDGLMLARFHFYPKCMSSGHVLDFRPHYGLIPRILLLVNCRKIMDEYTVKSRIILKFIIRAMVLSLNLEENSFLGQYGEDGLMLARFHFYPKCMSSGHVLDFRPHSGGTAITILVQDTEVEGLQVHKDDKWYRVPVIPNAHFVNAGDQMEEIGNTHISASEPK